ncbi:immunoglobulin-like domain-containing protein [Planococcus lenghuensis]|uniref:Bacterial Ig-like domain-containing protein n=1 Tax=Planococcus lenghuensis TaxID=2213202 RepID=A0A1Q2L0V3_9BACL|nr:immunoglobulin-like domain-containing protein [Planococcus lenghuensis]AQQ54036.1 hypothetical protein B0X71_13630 [Planococcus lenghuensis]
MKRILALSLVFLAACGNEETVPTFADPVPEQVMPMEREGISIALAEDSFTDPPVEITTTMMNESGQAMEFGEYFSIEVNKDGQWFAMDHSDAVFYKDADFKDYGKELPAGAEIQQTFSIKKLGETLLPGEYRLVKTFSASEAPFYETSVAVPFTVK